MLNLLLRMLVLVLFVLIASGCQLFSNEKEIGLLEPTFHAELDHKITTKTAALEDEESNEEQLSTKDNQERDASAAISVEVESKVVSLGIEGFQEEVLVHKVDTGWVKLWVDSSLELEESHNLLNFTRNDLGLSFTIELLEEETREQEYQRLERELLTSGYELLEVFPLENKEGRGLIYYSYDQRQSIDLYFLEEEKLLVSFVIPEEMERHAQRFEYMLDSIELKS